MDTKRLRVYANKYLAVQRMKAKLKELNEWIETESVVLIDHLIDEGVDKISLTGAGGITLFTKSLIWAKYDDQVKAVKAIKEAGFGDIVKEDFNHMRLASLLRDFDRNNEELPNAFKGIISANPKHSLIAKKL